MWRIDLDLTGMPYLGPQLMATRKLASFRARTVGYKASCMVGRTAMRDEVLLGLPTL